MPCDLPLQEWTIDIQADGQSDSDKAVIVFCLNIENGIINGVVSDITSGEPVALSSSVTGISQALSEIGLEEPPRVMTLYFTWGTSRVVLWGTTFRTGVTRRFLGRFSALETQATDGGPESDELLAPAGLGDSDTGTGTGTQT